MCGSSSFILSLLSALAAKCIHLGLATNYQAFTAVVLCYCYRTCIRKVHYSTSYQNQTVYLSQLAHVVYYMYKLGKILLCT